MKILEASSRIGGRVNDDSTFGHAVGIGAMFITGIINNPLTLLVRQCDLKLLQVQEDHCELLMETGVIADRGTDSKVEYQFNMNLDKLAEWREEDPQDISLYGNLLSTFSDMNRFQFSKGGFGVYINCMSYSESY